MSPPPPFGSPDRPLDGSAPNPPNLIDEASAPLDGRDRYLLARADGALERGLALRHWWRTITGSYDRELTNETVGEILAAGIHPRCFRLCDPSRRFPDFLNYGFCNQWPEAGEARPVVGYVAQMLFDMVGPEAAASDPVKGSDQALDVISRDLQVFVLRYFLRLSHYESAYARYTDPHRRPVDRFLQPLSWLPRTRPELGIGHRQLYYKRAQDGRSGKFQLPDQQLMNLAELKTPGKYTWIVLSHRSYDSHVKLRLNDPEAPYLAVPLHPDMMGVANSDFLLDMPGPRDEEDGWSRYGYGFALLSPPPGERVPLGGRSDFGFHETRFVLKKDGRILARSVMVKNRPKRFLEIPSNPLHWGLSLADKLSLGIFSPLVRPCQQWLRTLPGQSFDPLGAYVKLANALSGGLAARSLGISEAHLDRNYLHLLATAQMLALHGAHWTWAVVPRWSDETSLPHWVTQ